MTSSNPTLLVIGAQGQLARCLDEAAAAHNVHVVTIGRPDGDVRQSQGMGGRFAAYHPDVIVNTAAYTAVDQAETDVDEAFAVNRDGARFVADAAGKLGVPLIHVSTDYVFNGKADGAYLETDPIDPLGVYGRSKADGELLVMRSHNQSIILRTAWVYSAYGANFVKAILAAAAQRDTLQVVDDQRGAPTSAHDLAAAILKIAEKINAEGWSSTFAGVTHATATGVVSRDDFAREIIRLSAELNGPTADVEAVSSSLRPTAAERPANSELDCRRLSAIFGLQLPHWKSSLETCIRRMVAQ